MARHQTATGPTAAPQPRHRGQGREEIELKRRGHSPERPATALAAGEDARAARPPKPEQANGPAWQTTSLSTRREGRGPPKDIAGAEHSLLEQHHRRRAVAQRRWNDSADGK